MSGFFDSAYKGLGYLLSLPERTIRSLAAVAGGTTSLLTETLFPDALRGTTLYKAVVGDTQRFVIEKVAQVEREGAAGEGADAGAGDGPTNDFVQRKIAGTALEAAGLLAMHLSPLWVLAIAGDAAAGSGEFLQRLVVQLKRNNVLAPEAQINGLQELLTAISETSRQSAAAVDTPPLSREEVSKLATEMTENYKKMFAKATDLLPRFDTLWKRMEALASRENMSLERLGGILTVDVAQWGRMGLGAVVAVGQTSVDLVGEKILASYDRTLDAVSKEGAAGYLGKHMKPFVQAAADHFSPTRKTWTESMMDRVTPKATETEWADTKTPAGDEPESTPVA
jgi:molybdopterin-guanine dinucleotide biosynthesis protein A